MLTIKIHIDEETRKTIKSAYGKEDYGTVESVVSNIIERYLNVEHYDTKLNLDEDLDEDDDCEICEFCGEKSKHSRMIDIDGRNLEEHDVCENCDSGHPALE